MALRACITKVSQSNPSHLFLFTHPFSGSTCYMNSFLQTLFFTPSFRREITKWRYDQGTLSLSLTLTFTHILPCSISILSFLLHNSMAERDKSKARSIPYQLQRLFARMEVSPPSPRSFLFKTLSPDSHTQLHCLLRLSSSCCLGTVLAQGRGRHKGPHKELRVGGRGSLPTAGRPGLSLTLSLSHSLTIFHTRNSHILTHLLDDVIG